MSDAPRPSADAERRGRCYHAERGSHHHEDLSGRQSCSAFGGLLERTPSNQGSCSWLGPPSSGTRTPATLRGHAPNGHPCPDGALAASMPLNPLRIACVWPAPKSRLASTGLSRYEINGNCNGNRNNQGIGAAPLLILAGGRGRCRGGAPPCQGLPLEIAPAGERRRGSFNYQQGTLHIPTDATGQFRA